MNNVNITGRVVKDPDTRGAVTTLIVATDRVKLKNGKTYVMALEGAELILIGYNTPIDPDLYPTSDALSAFQNHLSLQSGAYLNALWVAATAKSGLEDGPRLLGGSAIVSPTGEVVAVARGLGDELVVADCDLEAAQPYRDDLFNLARHRRIEHYTLISERRSFEDEESAPAAAAVRVRRDKDASERPS